MVTTGMDNLLKVWDLRTYKMLHQSHSFTAASALDVSQTGLISVALGANIQVCKSSEML